MKARRFNHHRMTAALALGTLMVERKTSAAWWRHALIVQARLWRLEASLMGFRLP